jgi:hypothetical protein
MRIPLDSPMSHRILWYSVAPDGTPQEHDPVTLGEALDVVDRYFAQLRPMHSYTSPNMAVSETMVTFSRALHDELALCLNTSFDIWMWVQLPITSRRWIVSWFRRPFRFEEILRSRTAVRTRIQEYFTLSPDEFRGQLIKKVDYQTGVDPRIAKKARRGFRGYPVANILYFGPDATRATQVVVGIIRAEEAEIAPLQRWDSDGIDIRTDTAISEQILTFLSHQGAQTVGLSPGVVGCPHEEGVDYAPGTDCPQCPYWRNLWTGGIVEE